MTDRLIARARVAAKAIVAAVTPIVVALVADVAAELSTTGQGLVAAVATAAVVWLTPNAKTDGGDL